MFTRNVERAVRVAALIAVTAGPMWAAAQGATGSSGSTGSSGGTQPSEPSGGMGAAGAAKSPGGSADAGHMPPSPAAMQKMKPSQLYNMMDHDKDGFVTKEEFLKFQEKVFDSWDKAHTGRLGKPVFTDQG
jgi:hypothetical protein